MKKVQGLKIDVHVNHRRGRKMGVGGESEAVRKGSQEGPQRYLDFTLRALTDGL